MENNVWDSDSGSWNDGTNWSLGSAPLTSQLAVVTGEAPEVISGEAAFGTLDISATDLTLSGDFEGLAQESEISDSALAPLSAVSKLSTEQTLTISPWSFVQTATIDLGNTSLDITGELLVDRGQAQAVTVSGGEGFLGVGTALQVASLTVSDGAIVNGDVSFAPNGQVGVDDQSSLGMGTLSATGSTAVEVLAAATSPQEYTFSNGFATSQQGCFSFSSADKVLVIGGDVTGTGTLAFNNQAVSVAGGTSLAGTFDLTASSMSLDSLACVGPTSFVLDNGELSVEGGLPLQHPAAEVICNGASNTVSAGNANFDVSVVGSGSLAYQGGSGIATVRGGTGSLDVRAGSGDIDVFCGNSGHDRVTVGGGADSVLGGWGASISVIGGGQTTVTAGIGDETIDGSGATGADTYFGGSGGGTTTIRGGAGSAVVAGNQGAIYAVGGTGSFSAWAGTSGQSTLIGGSGADTLAAQAAGDKVYGHGSASNVLVGTAGGVYLDASGCSGAATVFAQGGPQVTTVIGGSGSETLVTLNGNSLIEGGTGTEMIWGGAASADTIIGGTGNDTIVASGGSHVQLNGIAHDLVVVYGGGATVDATAFAGSAAIFAQGSGMNYVACGGGSETVVAGSATLHAVGGNGYNAIFGGSSGHDTIIGGRGNNALFGTSGASVQAIGSGADYLQASGSNVTLNGAAASGWEGFVCSAGSIETTIYTGQGVSDVQALGSSATIHVVGGGVGLECGTGVETIALDATSVAGTLDIFGFDPSKDSIYAQGSAALPSFGTLGITAGGQTTITCGNEIIVLHGISSAGHF